MMVVDEKSYIEGMIPHHQEAIDTSKTTLQTTQDPELKAFLNNVISSQSQEINEMKTWYKAWYGTEYTPNSEMYMEMMSDLSKYQGVERDKIYIKGMISHHQSAVEMSSKVLTYKSNHAETNQLAKNIISTQSQEIKTLKDWLMSKHNDHSMM
jgi:uncharacterized protein (DUF305 family)